MTQKHFGNEKKEKEERKRRKKKKEKIKIKLIKIAIGILHISHILSSMICRLNIYINYFIFPIFHHHDDWLIVL